MKSGLAKPLPPAVPGEGWLIDDPRTGPIHVYGRPPERGLGPPVLLTHSANAAASAFEVRPVFERLRGARAVYAFDLPGFGLSNRRARLYTPRVMTDAVHAVVEGIRARHDGARVDALALSLSCEFLARAANEQPDDYRTLSFVSPTGLQRQRRDGPPGSTRGIRVMHSLVSCRLWSDRLYGALTKPGVVRYFLRRTFGRKDIDEGLHGYAVASSRQDGAKHAPLSFLSGYLFSGDATKLYEELTHPVWVSHGVRGDFVDYRGVERLASRPNWRVTELPTGALPWFEVPDEFMSSYLSFLDDPPA